MCLLYSLWPYAQAIEGGEAPVRTGSEFGREAWRRRWIGVGKVVGGVWDFGEMIWTGGRVVVVGAGVAS